LNTLLHGVKRVLLILGDYPNFDEGDFNTLRFQTFEIWPESKRNIRFGEIMTNYYRKIYLAHKKKNQAKTPAPKNFWPYQYQFYMCNPIPTFECIIKNANSNPSIKVFHYVEPDVDRSTLPSIVMPVDTLKDFELALVFKKAKSSEIERMIKPTFRGQIGKIKKLSIAQKREMLVGIDEVLRFYLPIRDTDRIAISKKNYARRTH